MLDRLVTGLTANDLRDCGLSRTADVPLFNTTQRRPAEWSIPRREKVAAGFVAAGMA
ncbi:hypothetical protein [Gordonia rhizosphera]|uniref:Uncharacterized protein n=1 Tax=Gordonia rhizosphera NBRC 16068 TaxID=1108045 RepID=K6UZW9_9ACTN|nr:hypothetical protein [Gordonia rhizosphera]GAB89098.1 hypothetical protein GORHZ_050_00150 [Gordonia rhizosphera NBRC 16068]